MKLSNVQGNNLDSFLYIFGAIAPSSIGLMLAKKENNPYWANFKKRILSFNGLNIENLALILGFVPLLLLVSNIFNYFVYSRIQDTTTLIGYLSDPKSLGLFAVLTFFGGPIMEELGWRGYFMDQLKKSNDLVISSIFVSLIWVMWHFPLVMLKGSLPYVLVQDSLVSFIQYNLEIFCYGVILGYILIRTKFSVLSAILFHFSINFFMGITRVNSSFHSSYTILLLFSTLIILDIIN